MAGNESTRNVYVIVLPPDVVKSFYEFRDFHLRVRFEAPIRMKLLRR